MFNKKSLRDIDVRGKRVLVRVDYNVPIAEGKVSDDTRIRAAMPTVEYLLQHGAALILCSHLGRPKDGPDPKYSMRPVAVHLSELLGQPVAFAEDCIGPVAEAAHADVAAVTHRLRGVRYDRTADVRGGRHGPGYGRERIVRQHLQVVQAAGSRKRDARHLGSLRVGAPEPGTPRRHAAGVRQLRGVADEAEARHVGHGVDAIQIAQLGAGRVQPGGGIDHPQQRQDRGGQSGQNDAGRYFFQ